MYVHRGQLLANTLETARMLVNGSVGVSSALPSTMSLSARGVTHMARATSWPEGRPSRQLRRRFRSGNDEGWLATDAGRIDRGCTSDVSRRYANWSRFC